MRVTILLILTMTVTTVAQPKEAAVDENPTARSLFNQRGNLSTRPGDMIISADQSMLENPDLDSSQSLRTFLVNTVRKAERIIRELPRDDATNAQRQSLLTEKKSKLVELAKPIVGQVVTISIEVQDVIMRKQPVKPEKPETDRRNNDYIQRQYEVALAKYEEELAAYEQAKYMIVGRIDWQSKVEYGSRMKADITNIKQWHRERIREIAKSDMDDPQDARKRARSLHDRALKVIDEICSERRPTHWVYAISNDEALMKWRRGQRRHITGITKRVGIYIHDQLKTEWWKHRPIELSDVIVHEKSPFRPLEVAYVGFEHELIIVKSETSENDEAPEAGGNEQAQRIMSMAHNYRKAGHNKTAREMYQQIIEMAAGSEEALEAQQWLDRMNEAEAEAAQD